MPVPGVHVSLGIRRMFPLLWPFPETSLTYLSSAHPQGPFKSTALMLGVLFNRPLNLSPPMPGCDSLGVWAVSSPVLWGALLWQREAGSAGLLSHYRRASLCVPFLFNSVSPFLSDGLRGPAVLEGVLFGLTSSVCLVQVTGPLTASAHPQEDS